MKKIILALGFVLGLSSCQNEVEFNNPAFQANINNVHWKSDLTTAAKTAGGRVTLSGRGQTGDLTFDLAGATIGTYKLGTVNQNNLATFTTPEGTTFRTGLNANSPYEIAIISGGTGYTASIAEATFSSGTGTGLKVKTTVNATGVITKAEIATSGRNYIPGERVTVSGGNQNATLQIVTVANSNGEVKITENTGATISGEFRFVSYANNGETSICREGIFYKVPLN